MKYYFVTGTDTDCGKTYITTQLVKCFSNSVAIKPVASGCQEINGELVSDDALELQKNSNLSLRQINPWSLKKPVSPHIAAKEEQIFLSAAKMANYCHHFLSKDIDNLFIEGAGGLMVPLNDHETWLDFLQMTGFPVILVVGMKLGCINHALLSSTVLQTHGIECAGWIANCLDPTMLSLAENIATLKEKMHMPLLGIASLGGGLELLE